MAKENYQELSTEELRKKEKSIKVLIWILIGLTIVLFYFPIRAYIVSENIDWSMIIIAICTLVAPLTLYPTLTAIQKEISSRY